MSRERDRDPTYNAVNAALESLDDVRAAHLSEPMHEDLRTAVEALERIEQSLLDEGAEKEEISEGADE